MRNAFFLRIVTLTVARNCSPLRKQIAHGSGRSLSPFDDDDKWCADAIVNLDGYHVFQSSLQRCHRQLSSTYSPVSNEGYEMWTATRSRGCAIAMGQ